MKINHKLLEYIALGLVGAFVWIFFWPSLFNGFTLWDDNIYLIENELIRKLSLESIKTMFTTDVSLLYTPLTSLTFALEYHFWGYNPLVYHVDNLIFHMLVTFLVFSLTRKMSGSVNAAFFSGLLFGIHPMHVESVAWVTERKDVLYSFFYMSSITLYCRYIYDKSRSAYLGSFILGILSVLAKPMALSLPLILMILDWFSGRKFNIRLIAEKVPFVLTIFPVAWISYDLNSRVIPLRFPESMLTWVWSLTFYIRKFAWPADLLPLYQLPQPVSPANVEFWGSALFLVFLLAFIIFFRKNRWVIFAFCFYFFSIFFLLRFDNKADLSFVADRFMYLPSAGFCILAGMIFNYFWDKFSRMNGRLFLGGLAGVVFIILGSMTFQQTKIWGDGIAFWDRVIKHYPDSAMAYNQRALAFKQNGDLAAALRDYSRAIELFPEYDFALTNRGIIYKETEKPAEAWKDQSRAIAVNPVFSEAYLNRGNLSFAAGEYKNAVLDYNKAIETVPVSARRYSTPYRAEVYSRRGAAYFFDEDYDQALKDFDKALAIDPQNIVALDNRAIIYSLRLEKEKAMADYAASLRLKPDNAVTYVNRAQLFLISGNREEALQDAQKALQINPHYQRAKEILNEMKP